jgi:hypothetical protein
MDSEFGPCGKATNANDPIFVKELFGHCYVLEMCWFEKGLVPALLG